MPSFASYLPAARNSGPRRGLVVNPVPAGRLPELKNAHPISHPTQSATRARLHCARAVPGRRAAVSLEATSTSPTLRTPGQPRTIGRAVADLRVLRLSGPPTWVTWLAVHLYHLIGFQSRAVVLTGAFSYGGKLTPWPGGRWPCRRWGDGERRDARDHAAGHVPLNKGTLDYPGDGDRWRRSDALRARSPLANRAAGVTTRPWTTPLRRSDGALAPRRRGANERPARPVRQPCQERAEAVAQWHASRRPASLPVIVHPSSQEAGRE
jgi:hypothetical protein